ncbi:MAG TPA: cation:proton antiporter [Noviherbaspirillum sp.]|jgi:NhaP-type Na+/H+ or K+/H+ antiporter|uniref:cation:proton antiporter n=1 Tax=Noviherbaspirillum sp. TaxID=1926288 RepID=UPI002DDC9F61|nr:cation:proton antiporter [Noviherbaspirillum sp.]HEV2609369.1 cation:proton antiporter [Noviherbaspirillum sp.]
MTNAHWFLLIGCLMLARGLAATTIMRLPITSAIFYLSVGLILGPTFLGIFNFDPLQQSAVLEVVTEIAVLISLFSAGVKMPVPVTFKRWGPPIRLAWVSMTITVAMVAAFAYFVLELPIGAGILLGAVLAPTDPVLATDVQVRHAGDKDNLRFLLTCEAGMNDGSAFPFVMLGLGLLGLHEIGSLGSKWLLVDVLWATLGAILIGAGVGAGLARIGWKLRGGSSKHEVLDDLVGLGLIAVVYGLCLWLKAWGFLAVFFAGVALRHTELVLAGAPRDRQGMLESDTTKSAAAATDPDHQVPLTVSAEALVFKEHLERLSELMLVLLLGGMIVLGSWSWRAAGMALFLFFVARPASVWIGLAGTSTTRRMKWITGWFGVRGIGSVYYLMYAIQHGLPEDLARELTQITLTVVMLSIFVHGISVKPLMDRFWRS